MVDAKPLFDDILKKLSSLRQELNNLHQSEQQRKQTEESLTRRNRMHTLLNSIRANIIKNRTREDLYDNVCVSFVESGLVHVAWIGAIDRDSAAVRPVTSARIDEERFGVRIERLPQDIGIHGTIVETVAGGNVFVSNNIASDTRLEAFHSAAERQHYRSLAAFPVSENGTIQAILILFSATEDFFSGEVVDNVRQVCRELSIGLQRLLLESDIRLEIETLKNTTAHYQQVADQHFIGIAVIQGGKLKYANEAIAETFGYSVGEMLQWKPNEFTKIIHPDDVEDVTKPEQQKAREIDGVTYYSYRIVTGQNRTRRIHRYSKTIFYAGERAHLIAVLDDEMMPQKQIIETEKQPVRREEDTTDRILFDNNPYPLLLIDFGTFAILQANNAAMGLYGYSEQEFREMTIRDLYPEDELSRFLDNLAQLPVTLQMEIATKHRIRDGTDIDVELAARYIRLADKTVVLMAARDVTNKKWAEEVVRESETNYRNIFNSIGYMVLVIDRDARILDMNNAAAMMMQQQREEVIGQDFDSINAKEKNTLEDFRNYLARAFEIGEERVDWYLQRPDGRVLPVEIVLHKGEYFGHDVVVAAARRSDLDKETVAAPDEISTTLESAPSAIAIANSEGEFTWANRAFAELIDVGAGELIGREITSLRAEGRSEEAFNRMLQTIYKGKVWSDEVIVQTGKEKETEIGLTVTPVTSSTGIVSRFVLTARNVAWEKERMQQILQKRKMESIDTISRAIAHDFNNILGIILGYASFLEKRKEDPEKFHADIEEIKNAVQRGANLIKQMLAYTHRNDVSYDSINVNEVVQDVAGVLGDSFPETIDISLELDERVPDVSMSRHQLQQIITELCVNARDAIEDPEAAHPGRGRIIIETHRYEGRKLRDMFPAAHENTYVEIRVTDTGAGMDEDTKSKAFDPFFSAKEYGKGKGLGLTSVYGVIKSYDGFIRIESEPKQGTVFMIYLPAGNDTGKSTDTVEEYAETPTVTPEAGGNTILVVEDEPSLLQLLQHVLEENGYRVLTASDGIEGVKVYESNVDDIALVVSDVGLPKLDGFNAFLQMRRINPNVNAVLASGYLDDKVKVDLYKEGIKDFIKKPYQTEEILSKINELVKEKN